MGKKTRREALLEKLEKITKDPETLKNTEEFHKKASRLTVKELLREFTI